MGTLVGAGPGQSGLAWKGPRGSQFHFTFLPNAASGAGLITLDS